MEQHKKLWFSIYILISTKLIHGYNNATFFSQIIIHWHMSTNVIYFFMIVMCFILIYIITLFYLNIDQYNVLFHFSSSFKLHYILA